MRSYSTAWKLSLVLCDNLEEWDVVKGRREAQEGGDMCIPMADSCRHMAETNTTLKSNYPPTKTTIFFKLKKQKRIMVKFSSDCYSL